MPAATAESRTAHIGTAQKQPPPSTYSKAEIDQKIDQLQQVILSTVPSRQELNDRIAKLYSKSDIDTALDQIRRSFPQQTVTQAELSARLTDADNIAKAREQQLYQSLDNKIPKVSPWVAIILATAGTSVSLFVGITSMVVANRATTQTQSLAQEKRADELHEEWTSIGWKHANAINTLDGQPPNHDDLNEIIDVAHCSNKLAKNFKGDRVTQKMIENADFKERGMEFWDALENEAKKVEVKGKIYHVKQELETLSPDAADFPLEWAKIVEMVLDISTQIAQSG
ncbi:MAG: hypothetical protein JO266_09070 [Acidobacteria bacterium]|nr:hypothetical protein [Acidobacteriota bacterium]